MPLPAIIPIIAALAGSAYNAASTARTSRKNTEQTIAANMNMSEYAYSQDKNAAELAYQRGLDMWKIQNQYNDPQSQMARLKAAGLNPNLVYGTGTVAGNQSGPTPRYDAPSYRAPNVTYRQEPFQMPVDAISRYQEFEMRQAQINNIKAQTENIHARTVSESFKKLLYEFGAKTSEFELNRRQDLSPYQQSIVESQAQGAALDVESQIKRISLLDRETVLRDLDIEYKRAGLTTQQINQERAKAETLWTQYRNQWMAMGITTSDNVALRVIIRMMEKAGISNPFQD